MGQRGQILTCSELGMLMGWGAPTGLGRGQVSTGEDYGEVSWRGGGPAGREMLTPHSCASQSRPPGEGCAEA